MAWRPGVCDDPGVLACPACSARLTPMGAREGVVYACRSCGGRAATLRALTRYATVAACDGLKAFARRPDAAPSVLVCPSCTRGMVLVNAPHVGVERLLDVCPRCDLVWFPQGDLSPMPRPAGAGADAATRAPLDPGARRAGGILHAARTSFDGSRPARLEDVPIWFGGPVELDPVRRATRPYATWAILAGLVLGALATISFDRETADAVGRIGGRRFGWFALFCAWKPSDFAISHLVVLAADPFRDDGWRLLAAFFAQANPWAAAAYGFWFWVFADDVEALLGRLRFVLLVFGASTLALLVAAGDAPREIIVYYGATGGLAAVVGCYAVLLPRVQLGFFGNRTDPVVRIPGWLAPLGLGLAEVVLRFVEAKEARLVLFTVGTAVGAGVGFLVRRSNARRAEPASA